MDSRGWRIDPLEHEKGEQGYSAGGNDEKQGPTEEPIEPAVQAFETILSIMPTPKSLAAEVQNWCARNADASQAQKYARYFKEGYDAWGFLDPKHPFFTEHETRWFEANRKLGLEGFLKAGAILFSSWKYEEGALAIRFVKRLRDELGEEHLGGLAKWFEAGIGNWAHTDVLCWELLAPCLANGQIEWRALAPWRQSKLKYQRRAVPVALLGLLKVEHDVAALLEFVRPMMHDEERVVHQGLGWFLREAWKLHPKPVEKFMFEHKDTAARLIFQYATEKMTAAERSRFKSAAPVKRAKAAKRAR